MSDEKKNIGGIELSEIKDSNLTIGNIDARVTAGGDIVGRDKIVHNTTQIIQQALSAVEEAEKAHSAAQKRLAEGVKDYVQRLQEIATDDQDAGGGGPYKGLLAYRLSDAELFFGRHRALTELLRRTRSDLAAQLAIGITAAQSLDNLLEQLVKSRLLSVEKDEETDEASYELIHDYLLTEIEISPEEQARKAAAELLKQEVEAYKRYGTLLDPKKYEVIQSQREFLRLDETAEELLHLSKEAIEAEERQKEAQRQRELEQQRALAEEQRQRAEEAEARRQEQQTANANLRKRALWLMGVGMVAGLLAVAAGLFGIQSRNNAELLPSKPYAMP